MATRWGICSAGRICHDFMVALKTLPDTDHQAVAVASRDSSRARDFAKRHQIPKCYGSYQELANDPNVDIVYVGTINPQHLKVALLMLQAGKNVLCEKPMAMNLKEVQQLISAARKCDLFLMEGLWTRFFPVSHKIRSLLSINNVGEIKMVRAEFGTWMLGTPRLVEKELGGGVLLDIGCYCLQFVCMVYNGEKPDSVHATGFLTEKGVDETVTIIIKYSRKRMAIVTVTMASQLPNQAIIIGTNGTITVPGHMWCPTSLMVNGDREEFPLPTPSQPLNFFNSTGLRYEAEEVRQCLKKGLKECPQLTLSDSELIMSILDEARQQIGVVYCQDTA
ncbi:LOW QUALITY PROTEIN: trans-1,2-dihydrobenzene-1,2-diol dehydrogenase-like [Leucoraja erinacea]|uniref:LOW QUALITY PROTEIN: trans-1,2-dihydrobenzene-1,2-diol dehydrogenase-like n=1 Tax=Leucoraja erinaceus TaxID=7782 RepID=UPI002456AF16|nr:LOW QUALITY PROTEIN: trans-1,2-dihydrobenzene-1,2-diol dehydrogenase-like [Leucoraja erinacea]